jgi:hypothetical protein
MTAGWPPARNASRRDVTRYAVGRRHLLTVDVMLQPLLDDLLDLCDRETSGPRDIVRTEAPMPVGER